VSDEDAPPPGETSAEPKPPSPAPAEETTSASGTAAPTLEHERRHTALFWAKLVAFLFVLGYAIAFVVDNDKTIPIDFVFATAHVSLIWTILLLLGVGVAGGALLSALYRHRRRQHRGQA
jgi:uncharacterized integral membrane protein